MVATSILCCWMIFFSAPSNSCCCFCRNSCSCRSHGEEEEERRGSEGTKGGSNTGHFIKRRQKVYIKRYRRRATRNERHLVPERQTDREGEEEELKVRKVLKHTIQSKRGTLRHRYVQTEREGKEWRRSKHTLTTLKRGATTDSCQCRQREEEGVQEHKVEKVPPYFSGIRLNRETYTQKRSRFERHSDILQRH